MGTRPSKQPMLAVIATRHIDRMKDAGMHEVS
jgi:hypothetical protein